MWYSTLVSDCDASFATVLTTLLRRRNVWFTSQNNSVLDYGNWKNNHVIEIMTRTGRTMEKSALEGKCKLTSTTIDNLGQYSVKSNRDKRKWFRWGNEESIHVRNCACFWLWWKSKSWILAYRWGLLVFFYLSRGITSRTTNLWNARSSMLLREDEKE